MEYMAVENLHQAVALRSSLSPGESVVTKQGVWLGRYWIRVQGKADKQSGILERRGQISEIFLKSKKLDSKVIELTNHQTTCRSTISETETKRENLQQEVSEITQQLGELKSQLSARLAKLEQAELQRERTAHDLDELVKQLALEEENTGIARERLQTAPGCYGAGRYSARFAGTAKG